MKFSLKQSKKTGNYHIFTSEGCKFDVQTKQNGLKTVKVLNRLFYHKVKLNRINDIKTKLNCK